MFVYVSSLVNFNLTYRQRERRLSSIRGNGETIEAIRYPKAHPFLTSSSSFGDNLAVSGDLTAN